MSERQKLKRIFTAIYSKVKSIQINNHFSMALEREASKTYVGMSDDFFFKQLCDLVFQSGLRGQVWQKYEPEIRKEFSDYKVKTVATYTQKDIERMLTNKKMLKHRKKIEACIHNAKEIIEISRECNGFWCFLDSLEIEEMVEKLRGNFKWMGYTNAYAFLRYVGMEVFKPDINVRRVLFRLGLLDSMTLTPQTYKQVQEIGRSMQGQIKLG